MNILESRLCVEYAEQEIGCDKLQNSSVPDTDDSSKYFNVFLKKLNSWNVAVSFHQPPPPHLKYLYPKPNRATINNIAHALASVPKFYTQVLHLMNKMNLPPPFSNIPDPPEMVMQKQQQQLQMQQQQLQQQTPVANQLQSSSTSNAAVHSTSESELESDPDDKQTREIIPMKRTKAQRKSVKKPKFIKPSVVVPSTKPAAPSAEEVFEKVDLQNQKKIEVKVGETLQPQANVAQEESIESFGIIQSQRENVSGDEEMKNDEEEEEEEEDVDDTIGDKVITEEELAANRISPKDFGVLPVFKNYHAGAPSCRVYIKNLAKNVTLRDLNFIYKRYKVEQEASEQGNMFDIRLMQEGRMKGQAFVTLQNVTQAQKAVKETNGYILKNKPLVVVFARSAVPKTKQNT